MNIDVLLQFPAKGEKKPELPATEEYSFEAVLLAEQTEDCLYSDEYGDTQHDQNYMGYFHIHNALRCLIVLRKEKKARPAMV